MLVAMPAHPYQQPADSITTLQRNANVASFEATETS